MKALSDLKIRTKLLGLSLLLILLMIFIGGFGVKNMAQMDGNSEVIGSNLMPGVLHLVDMRAASNRSRIMEYELIFAKDPGQIAAIESRLKAESDFMDQAMAKYEPLILSEENRRGFQEIKGSWKGYVAARDEVLSLVKKGSSEQAMKTSFGPNRERFDAVVKDVKELLDLNEERLNTRVEASNASYLSARLWTIVVIGVSVVVGILLALFLSSAVAKPLAEVRNVVAKAAEGDLTVRAAVQGKDEVGETAASMNAFLERLHESMTQVAQAASQVAAASEQLSASSEELSSGAQEQASSLEETSASLEEITSTVKQSAENAKQASGVAVSSRESAEKGGQVVESAVTAMSEINQSSKKIAEIIGVIDEIAFQTNLLALNAAVEAARAGEQGRGFAVVAAEVRNLAQRSATAAKEIKVLIRDSVQKVADGSELVNRSGETLHEIVTSVKKVTDFVADIASAGAEQASGIEQVNRAVSQMDQVVQSNSAQTEEMSATAEELAAQAQTLRGLVERFKLATSAATESAARQTSGAPRPSAKKSRGGRLHRDFPAPAKEPAQAPKPSPARSPSKHEDAMFEAF